MARKKSTDDIVLQRVSKRNMERILSIEPMQVGDSFDNVLSRVLDECEKKTQKRRG